MNRRAIRKELTTSADHVFFASRKMSLGHRRRSGCGDALTLADVIVTERTGEATIIQGHHGIPKLVLSEDQIIVYQLPIPEPLRYLQPTKVATRKMDALQEYGLVHVRLQ